MKVFDIILQDHDDDFTVQDYVRGIDFSEYELIEAVDPRRDLSYIDTVEGIDIWYNWRANYYVFAPEA